MVKVFGVSFAGRTFLLVLSEALLVYSAFWLATVLWFGRDADLALSYDHGARARLLACVVCMLCMYYYDLYESEVLLNAREVATRLLQVLGTVCVVLAVVYFAYPPVQVGRGPFVLWLTLGGVALLAWRRLFALVNGAAGWKERIAILGGGALARELVRELRKRPELGLELAGYVGAADDALFGLRNLGDLDEIGEVLRREGVSRLVVAMEERRGRLPVEELLRLKARGLRVQDGAELYEAITGKVPVLSLRPSSLLFSSGFMASRSMVLGKRVLSLALSLLGLAVGAPLMALIAAWIRLDSRGPALFRQKRVGLDGKTFTLYKFRTMLHEADPDLPAQPDDDRITRAGRWLRRTRLDELPQLFNILRGDMDFIGPRPFTPKMERELAARIPLYTQRWNVRPGITGWAQVHNGYCATLEDNIEKLSYDLFYIKHMSVGLDLLILFRTTKILLLGRGAR
ncbi:MAG: sugar transferase [Bryobacteraceae bacterium]